MSKKKKKRGTDEVVKVGLKKATGFTGGLLINIVIVFLVIKVFSFAFDFTYSVFGDVAKDPISREVSVVEIPADSSILQIGEALEDSGIIDNKYAFWAKIKIKGYSNMIIPGKYGLSPAMTYEEIINVICRIELEEEEE
ncbi:MAG: endolytic transglycosylase MltG [Lachnospiraceae bacterium]|nr:endolytic transglycosylase MltG [Lachnospiraceae bacterium]